MIYAATGSNDTWIGKNLGSARPRMEFANSLAKIYDEAEDTNMQVWAESGAITLTPTTFVRIDDLLYINELANTGMTTGITINQADADDEILAFKASEVNHIFTDRAEADTYATFQKITAAAGGLDIWGFRDTDSTTLRLTAMNVSTTPTVPALQLRGGARDGVGNDGTIVADGYPVMLFTNWSQEIITCYGGPQVVIGNVGEYNTKQTAGLTIDQRANDDEILAFKSSDVTHGLLTYGDTNTYASFSKQGTGAGGLKIIAIAEGGGTDQIFQVQAYGGTADTTKSDAGIGLFDFRHIGHDGADGLEDIVADGNLVSFRCRTDGSTKTVWILDEDGDTWQSGKATIGAGTTTIGGLVQIKVANPQLRWYDTDSAAPSDYWTWLFSANDFYCRFWDHSEETYMEVLRFQQQGNIDVGASSCILDEDNMASDDAGRLATQQSIKAYVDNKNYLDLGTILTGNGSYVGTKMTVVIDDGSTVFGNVLSQASDFHYDRADADSATTAVGLVMALSDGSGTNDTLIEGQVCDTDWDWDAGLLYLSAAVGEMTQTAPAGTGDQVVVVGWALSADTIYFKPSLVLVEVA
jgi:hypothetical protein